MRSPCRSRPRRQARWHPPSDHPTDRPYPRPSRPLRSQPLTDHPIATAKFHGERDNLATLRARREGILAAIRLGLSNGRMEGLNSKVRLLSHRSFGFHSPTPLIALIYLCCSQLTITPPLR